MPWTNSNWTNAGGGGASTIDALEPLYVTANDELAIRDGSITQKGAVQLISDITDTTSETKATTPKYVNDLINASLNTAESFRGDYNASSNQFPTTGGSGISGAIQKGDYWRVSVAGIITQTVVPGNMLLATTDAPGQTNWAIFNLLSKNLARYAQVTLHGDDAVGTPYKTLAGALAGGANIIDVYNVNEAATLTIGTGDNFVINFYNCNTNYTLTINSTPISVSLNFYKSSNTGVIFITGSGKNVAINGDNASGLWGTVAVPTPLQMTSIWSCFVSRMLLVSGAPSTDPAVKLSASSAYAAFDTCNFIGDIFLYDGNPYEVTFNNCQNSYYYSSFTQVTAPVRCEFNTNSKGKIYLKNSPNINIEAFNGTLATNQNVLVLNEALMTLRVNVASQICPYSNARLEIDTTSTAVAVTTANNLAARLPDGATLEIVDLEDKFDVNNFVFTPAAPTTILGGTSFTFDKQGQNITFIYDKIKNDYFLQYSQTNEVFRSVTTPTDTVKISDGLIIIDASANSVILNFFDTALYNYKIPQNIIILRADESETNTVTINTAGSDLFIGNVTSPTSFTLDVHGSSRSCWVDFTLHVIAVL